MEVRGASPQLGIPELPRCAARQTGEGAGRAARAA